MSSSRTLTFALLGALSTFARGQSGVDLQDLSAPPSDELDLEALMSIEVRQVYGASMHDQSALDAPSSVSILTGEEIRRRQYRTLQEALDSLCGVYSTYDRSYYHTGVRGFSIPGDYNSRLLLLVNGHRLNDPIYGTAAVGYEAVVDLDTVERIEFIRGPGSSLYGSSAVFGVVNVVTRRGADSPGFEASVSAASEERFGVSTQLAGVTRDGVDYLVSVRGFDAAGNRLVYDEYAATPTGGVTRDTDYESGYGLFARATRGEFSVETGYVFREKGVPTGQFGVNFDDPDNRIVDAQGYFDLSWRRELDSGAVWQARAYYDNYWYRGWYIYDDTANGGPPDLVNRDDVRGQRLGVELNYAFQWTDTQRLTVGGEGRWNLQQDQHNYDANGDYANLRSDSVNGGVFAQDEIAVGRRTHLVLGARVDQYESFGGTLTPRAALIHRPDDDSAIKLLYGEAFRAPNVYELEYGDNYSAQANPDLDPERIRTYELVYERYFEHEASLTASVYHYDVTDLIAQRLDTGSGLLMFDNIDEVVANGVEVEGSVALSDSLRLTVSQALQDVEASPNGDTPPDSPRHITRARLESEFLDGSYSAVLEGVAMGPRGTVAGDRTDGYFIANLALRAKNLRPGLALELAAYNLFDTSYSQPVSADFLQDAVEQNGLRVALRLRYSR